MGKRRRKKVKVMSEKEVNPCDKCPWKNRETCESCELKDGKEKAKSQQTRL